jgi:hypothetical protein
LLSISRDIVTGALSAYVGETALVTAKGDGLQLTSRAVLTVAMLLVLTRRDAIGAVIR